MSIKLYGMTYSNYYNMVKAVMIEKGMDFEEVLVLPNQDEAYLSNSPMGKVPCMETADGFLTETSVMMEYLHDLGEGPSFFPEDAFQRAKVRELIHYLELYIELPARRLYGDVFFQRPATDALKEEVHGQLRRGFAALSRLARYQPYLAGSEITYADFFFRFSVGLATVVTKKALDWDTYKEIPELKPLLDRLDQRPSIQQVLADQKAAA